MVKWLIFNTFKSRRAFRLGFLGIFLLCSLGVEAMAQSQCPPGMIPRPGGCSSPVGGNSSNYETIYQNRYGAMATSPNPSNNVVGTATAQRSRIEAMELALSKCGPECRIWFTVVNTCMAVSEGDGEAAHGVVGIGQSLRRAEKNSRKECESQGFTNCEVKFSSCSLPERVN